MDKGTNVFEAWYISALRSLLRRARQALVSVGEIAPGYDWNSNPRFLTRLIGDTCAQIDALSGPQMTGSDGGAMKKAERPVLIGELVEYLTMTCRCGCSSCLLRCHAAASRLVKADELRRACEVLLACAPAFRSRPLGAAGSVARAEQDAHIAAEDAARAAIARFEAQS